MRTIAQDPKANHNLQTPPPSLTPARVAQSFVKVLRAKTTPGNTEESFQQLDRKGPEIFFRYDLRPRRGYAFISATITDLTGYVPAQFYADPDLPLRLVHPADRRRLMEAVYRGGPGQHTVAIRWWHRNNRIIWSEWSRVPIYDDEGTMVAIEGTVHEITDRTQVEERLLHSQRLEASGRVVAQVAHDLNNLLVPLQSIPDAIKNELPPGHAVQWLCDVMLRNAYQIAEITQNLLALGRRGRISFELVDLNKVVEEQLWQLGQLPAGLVVRHELAQTLPPISGARTQLARVLSNLLANARDAMHDAGVLTITTAKVSLDGVLDRYDHVERGEYVRLSVGDTGVGIASEIREQIFEPYFTTKRADTRRGSGLGLSVVEELVADHGGYVDLTSEVGRGTTFSVYLPVGRIICPADEPR